MPPILPIIGLAALGVIATKFARREIERVTRKLNERDQGSAIAPDGSTPVLRRDPRTGEWRPDPEQLGR